MPSVHQSQVNSKIHQTGLVEGVTGALSGAGVPALAGEKGNRIRAAEAALTSATGSPCRSFGVGGDLLSLHC